MQNTDTLISSFPDLRWEMTTSFFQFVALFLSSACMILGISLASIRAATIQQRLALNLFAVLQLSAVFGACFVALLMFAAAAIQPRITWHEMAGRYNALMRLSAVSFGVSAAGFIVYLLIMMWINASNHWSGLTVSSVASVVFVVMFCMVVIAIVQTKCANK